MSTVALAPASDARGVSATFAPIDTAPSATEAAEASADDAPFVDGAAATVDCAPTVRAHIDQRAARVLVCVADPAVAVTASWEAGGTVSFGVGGAADSTVLECVQAAIGALSCPGNAGAGRLLHPLAR